MTTIHTHELHILIGCADARDLNHLQVEVTAEKVAEYAAKGIEIEIETLRVAGSFITADVIMDIKRIIEEVQRQTSGKFKTRKYFIHIQTHGHLEESSNREYVSHIYEMNLVQGSPLNCGMLGATGVGIELEQLILEEKPVIQSPKGSFTLDTDEELLRLMKEVYGYHGYLAGDWLKSIGYLRTHPREQRAILEETIEKDSELSRLGIKISAGIVDYSVHGLIRVDGGLPKIPFWDEMQQEIRNRAVNHKEELAAQAEKQKPLAGLLSVTDPKQTARSAAAEFYHAYKGIPYDGAFLPNTIFQLSGSGFDLPDSPFGPYVIGGFFYAVKHLHLTDQIVMGADEEQVQRIIRKVHHDPIMNLVVKKFKVNLISFVQ